MVPLCHERGDHLLPAVPPPTPTWCPGKKGLFTDLREGMQHGPISLCTAPKRLGPRSHTKAHEEIRECPVPGHPGLRPPSAFARMASRAVAHSASRGRMRHRSRRDDRRCVKAPSRVFVPARRAASCAFAAVISSVQPATDRRVKRRWLLVCAARNGGTVTCTVLGRDSVLTGHSQCPLCCSRSEPR